MTITAVFRPLARLDGFVSASLVEPETGTVLDGFPSRDDPAVRLTAAAVADIVQVLAILAARQTADGEFEDLTVETANRLHLGRLLAVDDETLLLVVTFDRRHTLLAVALRQIRNVGAPDG